ncbi:hypothetical protein LSTR_LSTR004111 [Laodelphax striatellus]|uniref:Uncharacterized protein n=1 Tax=Laodelphax striatellus TaxID=195883 RepID=A0A482WGS0_LAOST|nr:hypothetical protein LSTR_LSTR004111 [Laodelphax striatellus]
MTCLNEKIELLSQEISNLQRVLESSENKYEDLKVQELKKCEEISELRDKIHSQNQEIITMRNDYEVLTKDSSKELASKVRSIENLNDIVSTKEQELVTYQDQIECLKVRCSEKDQEIYNLNKRLDIQTQESLTLNRNLERAENDLVALKAQEKRNIEEISKLASTHSQNQEIIILKEELEKLEKNSSEELASKVREIETLSSMISRKEKELTTHQNEIESLKKEYSEKELQKDRKMAGLIQEVEVQSQEITTLTEQIDSLNKELRLMKKDHETLKSKYRDLEEIKTVDVEAIRNKYEEKLDLLKEKMKRFWREDVKQKAEEFEGKLRQYKEKICKDETHIAELSSQLWETSDRLLRTQKEFVKMKTLYEELRLAHEALTQDSYARRRSLSVDAFPMKSKERDTDSHKFLLDFQDESESGNPRRRSLLPSGMGKKFLSSGRVFPSEDETGEVFDNRNLAELKEGRYNTGADEDRMSILMMRNSLCPPHLKSSYPAETQFLIPDGPKENDIKSGTEVICQSGALKKRDRTQITYKKPGPPTPSKNGGRLGNQESGRSQGGGVLRELQLPSSASSRRSSSGSTSSAAEPRTSITPSRLRALFTATGRRTNRDENTPTSVKDSPSQRNRLSFFNRHFRNRDSRSQF